MENLQIEPCPCCQSIGAQRAGWEELQGQRVVTMILCTYCGNSRLDLASFLPKYHFTTFDHAASMARIREGQRH